MEHDTMPEIEGMDFDFLSTDDSPELTSQASEAALIGDRPLMTNPPSGQIELPGGWFDREGNLHNTAVVKELNGHAEERLARIDIQANFPLFLQTLVKFGLDNIGGHEPSDTMLQNLLVGDREMLILGIRIATYGNELEMHIRCPDCQAEEDIAIELDQDIPIRKMDDPACREHTVTLRDGRTAVVEPVTAGVQDIIWDPKKTPAELKTAALERCVRSIDGRPVTEAQIKDLGLADRKKLMEKLSEVQPGPDYGGVSLPCQACGKEFSILLDLDDLFR